MYTLVMLTMFFYGGPVANEKMVSTHPSAEACYDAIDFAVKERNQYYSQVRTQVVFICRPGMPVPRNQ